MTTAGTSGRKATHMPMMTVTAIALPTWTNATARTGLHGPGLHGAVLLYRLLYGSSATSRARLIATATCR